MGQTAGILAFEGLFQHVQLLVEFGVGLALGGDFSHGVQHGRVVSPAEQFADFGQAFLRQLFGQKHGNLARPSDAGGALFAVHVGDFDFVEVGGGFLDVFDADLAVLNGQEVF